MQKILEANELVISAALQRVRQVFKLTANEMGIIMGFNGTIVKDMINGEYDKTSTENMALAVVRLMQMKLPDMIKALNSGAEMGLGVVKRVRVLLGLDEKKMVVVLAKRFGVAQSRLEQVVSDGDNVDMGGAAKEMNEFLAQVVSTYVHQDKGKAIALWDSMVAETDEEFDASLGSNVMAKKNKWSGKTVDASNAIWHLNKQVGLSLTDIAADLGWGIKKEMLSPEKSKKFPTELVASLEKLLDRKGGNARMIKK